MPIASMIYLIFSRAREFKGITELACILAKDVATSHQSIKCVEICNKTTKNSLNEFSMEVYVLWKQTVKEGIKVVTYWWHPQIHTSHQGNSTSACSFTRGPVLEKMGKIKSLAEGDMKIKNQIRTKKYPGKEAGQQWNQHCCLLTYWDGTGWRGQDCNHCQLLKSTKCSVKKTLWSPIKNKT